MSTAHSTSSPLRPRTRLGALSLAASLVVAASALTACSSPVPVTRGPGAPASSTSSQSPSPQGHSTPSRQESASPGSGSSSPAVWQFPISYDGWSVTRLDDDGINQISSAQGCTFTSTQNTYDDAGREDRQETEYQAGRWVKHLKSNYTNVQHTQSESTQINADTQDGHAEFIKVESTYTDQGTEVRSVTWMRVFTSNAVPTFNLLDYSCPVASFDETQMNDLLAKTTLVNSGPARMDDGHASHKPGASSGTDT